MLAERDQTHYKAVFLSPIHAWAEFPWEVSNGSQDAFRGQWLLDGDFELGSSIGTQVIN